MILKFFKDTICIILFPEQRGIVMFQPQRFFSIDMGFIKYCWKFFSLSMKAVVKYIAVLGNPVIQRINRFINVNGLSKLSDLHLA